MRLPWMSRTDRRAWKGAATLEETGALMARWLEGDIASRPGYQPRYGPEAETEDLVPVLAALNRQGYVTTDSQPGVREFTTSGAFWFQRAAVTGFVRDPALVLRLVDAAETAGLKVIVNDFDDAPGHSAAAVTTCDGELVTAFGGALPPGELQVMWRGLGRGAYAEITRARQLTLVDTRWGPSALLWDAMDSVVTGEALKPEDDGPRCAYCGCTDNAPCPGGCWWVVTSLLEDVCSACVSQDPRVVTEQPF